MVLVLSRLGLGLFVLFALAHAVVVGYYHVDILHVDEWVVWWDWESKHLGEWIFARYNEHILAPAKLQIYLLHHFFQGSHFLALLLSYLCFFLTTCWIYRVSRPVAIFCVFLFCTLPYENHYLPFSSHFHLAALFCFGALSALIHPKLSWGRWALGVVLALVSMVTLSAGVAGAVAVGVLVALWAWFNDERAKGFSALGVILVGAYVWKLGHVWIPQHPKPLFPLHPKFWDFFLNILSSGFGIDRLSTLIGALCFLFVLIPLVGLGLRRQTWKQPAVYQGMAAVGVCFALIASIAIGRANAGMGAAKSSRYSEYALFVLPLTAKLYFEWLKSRGDVRNGVLIGLFFLCTVFFSNNWSPQIYADIHSSLARGRECARKGLNIPGPLHCPDLLNGDLRPWLERAKRWDAGLIERLRETN